MSDIQGPFSSLIEDYTGVITSNVVPAGQHRWYNKYDNQDATRVVYVIGDGTSTIAALDKHSLEKTDEEVSTTTATIAAAGGDHTVFVDTDTAGAAVALTITDAGSANDRLTVVAIGTYKVTLTITGLTSEEVPIGEARSYVWSGTAFVLASGGGGGGTDLAEIQVPQPNTWVEKYKDYTNTSGILNQWGDGVYLFTLIQDTTTRSLSTILSVNMADSTVTGNIGSMDGRTTDDVRVQYDIASNTFNVASVSGNYYIAEISRWEDDPDNLPLQTVPSDPSLIKDWVEKLSTPQTVYAPVTNSWGSGKYLFTGMPGSGNIGTFILEVDIDALGAGNVAFSATTDYLSNASVSYDYDSNTFISSASYPFQSIKRWEDVAGADAQLSVPVDGWEQKFYDYTNISDVTNSWGDGEYIAVLRRSDNLVTTTSRLKLDIQSLTDLGATDSDGSQSGGVAGARLRYTLSTNTFTVSTASGIYYIAEIHKFNSLVNVLHSYVPDPRSAAQKDWVEKYSDDGTLAATSIPNTWGTGKYLVYVDATGTLGGASFVFDIKVIGDVITMRTNSGDADSLTAQVSAANNFIASTLGSLWSSPYISRISRWEDSQASDAPRTVLEDGWENIYDDAGNTALTIDNTWGTGYYRVTAKNSLEVYLYSVTVLVDSLLTRVYAPNLKSPAGERGAQLYHEPGAPPTFTIADDQTGDFYITKIDKFTGLLRIDSQVVTNTSEGSNITNAVIDTDAGDVDCTSYFVDTTQDRVVKLTNDGTNGNHLTNCPNSIEIGDGKTVQFYYNLGWRYEDVCIEESYGTLLVGGTGVYTLKKWAGGSFVFSGEFTSSSAISMTLTMPVSQVGTSRSFSGAAALAGVTTSRFLTFDPTGTTGNILKYRRVNTADANTTGSSTFKFEGRWKTGI